MHSSSYWFIRSTLHSVVLIVLIKLLVVWRLLHEFRSNIRLKVDDSLKRNPMIPWLNKLKQTKTQGGHDFTLINDSIHSNGWHCHLCLGLSWAGNIKKSVITAQTASTFREAGGSRVANSIYTSQLNQQIFDCGKIKKVLTQRRKGSWRRVQG